MSTDDLVKHLDLVNKVASEYLKGHDAAEISRSLDIPRPRVMSLLSDWRVMASNNQAIHARAKEALAGADQHFSSLIKKAYEVIDAADSTANLTAKTTAIKLIADIESKRLEMLQKAGLLDNKEISSNEPINENIVQSNDNVVEEPIKKEEVPTVEAKDIVGEVSRIRLSEEDLVLLEKFLNRTPQVTPQVEEELNIPTQDIPEEFNQIINENFWDLTHDEKPKEETIEPTPNSLSLTEEALDAIKEQYEERADYGYSFDESMLPPQPPIESYENDLIPEEDGLDGYDGFLTEEVIQEITETPTPEEVKVVETPTPEEVNEVEPEKPYGFEYTQELDMALNPIETPEPTPTPVVEEEVFEEDEDIDDDVLTIDLQVQPQDDPTPIAEEEEIIEEPTPEVTETTLPPDESEEEKKN